jgi:hypothetical protein
MIILNQRREHKSQSHSTIFLVRRLSHFKSSFYLILFKTELTSKNKIRPIQAEPYGPIDIEMRVY